MKPPHTTATELAFLPDMFDQRLFTSFLQQTALLVINYRDNEQTRQTTGQHDNPPRTTAASTPRSENGPATRQLTQPGFDDCPTQPVASSLINRSHAARLQRHPPAFDACRWSNTTTQTPSPINPSNNTRRQQLKLARSSPLHAVHIQKPPLVPRLLKDIHSFDIDLETSGTHKYETALINQKPPLVRR